MYTRNHELELAAAALLLRLAVDFVERLVAESDISCRPRELPVRYDAVEGWSGD
jgi:hypothetical protein